MSLQDEIERLPRYGEPGFDYSDRIIAHAEGQFVRVANVLAALTDAAQRMQELERQLAVSRNEVAGLHRALNAANSETDGQ